MKFYIVSDAFIDFLKKIDNKVPNNYKRNRAFVGIVLEINEHKYFAPLTSYKPKQDTIRTSLPTIMKLHERGNPSNKLGMIQLNNMIPVIESEIQLLDIENQPEPYRSMLYKQYEFINARVIEIKNKAKKLYDLVVDKKQDFYCKISCDFKSLEDNYRNFG
ncbi:MAG: type III toxin-antitoxin system ToxN/AbiQ family toxin [Symploca sp. SIO2E6]|nr:type III toxin-antitoxin system ToxN/AbiQ family toxin [Symploca sp. SIO2E6]